MAFALHRFLGRQDRFDDALELLMDTTKSMSTSVRKKSSTRRSNRAVARLFRVLAIDLEERGNSTGAAEAHAAADALIR